MKKKSFKKRLFLSFLFLVIVCLLIFGYSKLSGNRQSKEKIWETYQIQKPSDLSFIGKVEARQTQKVTYDQNLGTIEEINVDENQQVEKGDSLITYHAKNLTTGITETEIVKANFDGLVHVNPNAINDTTQPVVSISSNETIIRTQVSEFDIEKINIDQGLTFTLANKNDSFEGKVTLIQTTPDATNTSITNYPIEISTDQEVPLGFSVTIRVSQNDVRIPISAIFSQEGKKYVFKFSNGKAIQTEIKGQVIGEYFSVEEGLVMDDIILSSPDGLTDNMEVKTS